MLGVPTINTEATAGAIYLVRNPLDIALSLAPHMGISVDEAITMMAKVDYHTAITADTAFAVIGSWSQTVASWIETTSRSVLVVRYEDMIATPLILREDSILVAPCQQLLYPCRWPGGP